MNESPTSGSPKSHFPILVLVFGVVALMVFALSMGGLTYWLLSRSSTRQNTSQPGFHAQEISVEGLQPVSASAQNVDADEFVQLFNGHDLTGWDFDPSIWSVRNGVIYGHQQRGGHGSSLFWQEPEIGDFELRFRFRLLRGNSGVYYRANRLANFVVGGYEFEIYTNRTGNLADNGTDREKRRLYRTEAPLPIDSAWHEGVIIAQGARLLHSLDGNILFDLEDTHADAPRAGAIALAITSSTAVEFANFRLKRYPPK